jgi:hypothetical protein
MYELFICFHEKYDKICSMWYVCVAVSLFEDTCITKIVVRRSNFPCVFTREHLLKVIHQFVNALSWLRVPIQKG